MCSSCAGTTQIATRELLTTLEPEDIEVAGVNMSHLSAMADTPGQVRLDCPHCQAEMTIDDKRLATEVTCESCSKPFEAAWGEPVVTPDPSSSE